MKLYLVQHAKAKPKDLDADRPLSEQGLEELQKIASFIKPVRITINRLWHSGKTRTAQTAEVLAGAIESKKGLSARSGLGPNDNVAVVRNEIVQAGEDIMIVGHLPFLTKLASLLLSGDESADTVAFRNAGIVSLSCCEADSWQIDWIVIPDILS